MKRAIGILLSCVFACANLHAGNKTEGSSIHFTENKGQVSDQFFHPRPDIFFVAAGRDYNCHFKKSGYSLQFSTIKNSDREMRKIKPSLSQEQEKYKTIDYYRIDFNWVNSNKDPLITAEEQLSGYENFYLEVCPAGIRNVRSFAKICYKNLFAGIDLKWYEKNGQLKYDFNVKAGADYKQIRWRIDGAAKIYVDSEGRLHIETVAGHLKEDAPLVIQDGKILSSAWRVEGSEVSFLINDADGSRDFTIDPLIRLWGSYYGGNGYDEFEYSATDAREIYTSPVEQQVPTFRTLLLWEVTSRVTVAVAIRKLLAMAC